MASKNDEICIPGMRLSVCNDEFIAGFGTNESMGYIYATIAGFVKKTVDEESKTTIISIESPKTPSLLPKTGDIVTARVTVVNPRVIHCTLICVNEVVLPRQYKGIIKKEDIMANEREQVNPYKCYKPGDIILAKVLPTSNTRYFGLSTIDNELGVVIAKADDAPVGVNMVPISWTEMQCPKTLVKEKRKVAKVLPEKLLVDPKQAVISNVDAGSDEIVQNIDMEEKNTINE